MQLTASKLSVTCNEGRIRSADSSSPRVTAFCFGLLLRTRSAVRNDSLIKIKCQFVSQPRSLSSRRKLLDSDFSERDTSCHSHLIPAIRRGEKKVTSVTRHDDKNQKAGRDAIGKNQGNPVGRHNKKPEDCRRPYDTRKISRWEASPLHLLKGKRHRTCPMSHRTPPSGWRTIRRTLRARREWSRHTLTAPLRCKIRSVCACTACLLSGVAAPCSECPHGTLRGRSRVQTGKALHGIRLTPSEP